MSKRSSEPPAGKPANTPPEQPPPEQTPPEQPEPEQSPPPEEKNELDKWDKVAYNVVIDMVKGVTFGILGAILISNKKAAFASGIAFGAGQGYADFLQEIKYNEEEREKAAQSKQKEEADAKKKEEAKKREEEAKKQEEAMKQEEATKPEEKK